MTATAAGVMLCGPCFGRHVRLVSDVVVSIDSLLQEYQSWTKRLSCIKWFARVAAPIFKFKDFGSSAEPAWPMVHFSGPLVRTTQQPPKQNHSSGIMTTNTDGRERFVGSFINFRRAGSRLGPNSYVMNNRSTTRKNVAWVMATTHV
jgi:hypothetical protein